MADIITRLKFETDEFHNRARRATTEINQISQQLEKAGVRVDHMNAKNLKLAQSFGQMQTVSTTLRGKISELSEEFVAWSHHYNQITEEQKRSPYGKAIVEQLDVLRGRIQQTKSELAGIEGSLSGKVGGAGFGKQLLNGLVPGLGAGLGMAGVMAAVKAVNLLKDATIDTIKTNMEFEQSNANLAAILGKTTDEIYELTENAKQLGGSTIYTASQISELQTVLSRRGFNQSQILNMTHGIANLATATGTDLAESAELAASTMQAFGLKATDMERIVSTLGVSTTKSALTTQALGVSLQYVAPTARAAGFSLEDTVAMLGALVDSGLDASTAGTSLRQIILGMSTANGKLANSFGHPIRGLNDFVESIKKLKENGGASLDAISKKVRVTAVPAFLSLVENADRLNELRDSITGVEDELQTMADKQIDTAKGATIILKSAWEGLMLTFSESNGTIKDGVQLLTEYINKWKEARQLDDGGQGAVNAMIGNEDDFRRETERRAKEWVQDWNNNQMLATMRGGGAAGSVAGTGFGVLPGVTWQSNLSEYASAQEEATAELQKQRELYEKLIPLSKQYADYKDGKVSPHTPAAVARWGEGKDAKAQIEELTGQSWDYNSFQQYLTNMYKNIKMYEAVVNAAGTDDFSGVLVEDEVSGSTTGTVTIVERAKDIVAKAILKYEQELKELQNRLRAGLIDQAEFDKRKVGLDENVWEAYGRADMLEPMQEWKDGMAKWGKQMKEDADIASNSGAIKKMIAAEQKYAQTFDLAAMKEEQGLQDSIAANRQRLSAEESLYNAYANLYAETKDPKYLEEMNLLAEAIKSWREIIKKQEDELKEKQIAHGIDNKTLNGLISVAKDATKGMDPAKFGGGTALDYFGLSGIKERLNADLTLDIPDKEWKELEKKINAQLEALGKPKIEIDVETGNIIKLHDEVKNMAGAWQYASQAIGSVSSAMSSLEDPTAKVAGIIAGAIAQMAAGLGAAIAQKGKELEPWSWIAFSAAATATLVSTVAAVKQATEYHADGGFIGGGPKGSDTIPMWGTPGELVLTRSMQSNLANQLQAPQMLNMDMSNIHFEIQGRKLIGVINNEIAAQGGGRSVRIFSH